MNKNHAKVKCFFPIFLLIITLTACEEKGKLKISEEVAKTDPMKSERTVSDYEEAIRNFKELLKKEPDNVILLISLGNAYFDIGHDMEAIKVYRKALEIYPDNVAVRTDLGTAYRRIGQPDKALEEYRKSLAIDPRHSISRYNMGVVLLWDKKKMEEAITVWEELLRIDPYFVLAEELKNNIKLLKDMLKEARERKT
ncbi:MAG: tetratricopeptide repeat protein [Deltaproteobacteria bacterium]|nr:tetratricopeptide repeat protein [Deltaproteobacteria bacterium]